MNKFRKLGFIHYDGGGLEVNSSLLNVICTINRRSRCKPSLPVSASRAAMPRSLRVPSTS